MTLNSIYCNSHWEGSQYTGILQSALGMSSGRFLEPHTYVKSREYNYINCTFSMNTFTAIKVLIFLHIKNTLHRFISFKLL